MTTTRTIPVTISPEATRHVMQLGLWSEFEEMLEHTKHAVPNLESISSRIDALDSDDERVILIIAEKAASPGDDGMADVSAEQDWDRWAIATFPAEVRRHFCMMAL